MLHLFRSSQTDWIRNVGCSFTCNLPLQYQIFWWPKHFDLLFLWTHIIIRIWTARCIINCINYDLNFLKLLDGQTPPFAVTAVRMSKLDFETTLHLGDMAKSLAKAQLVQSKYANMPDVCVEKRMVRQGPRRWNSWRWREAKKSMDRICVASPYLMMIDHCLIAKWKHHQHIIWCSLFDL